MDFVFDPSLVLYLPLYQLDGASFVSKDAHGHLCTVTGALWRPDGHYFDGADDNIEAPNHSSLQITQATLSSWIKTSDAGAGYRGILTKTSAYVLNMRDNVFGSYDYVANAARSSGVNTADDVWHLLVVTMDSGVASGSGLWVDGELKANVTLEVSGQSHPVVVGAATAAGAEAFGGTIGEARVYNRILTPQEIQNIYLATKWRYR